MSTQPDLLFYTNEELVVELLNRTTFAGVILRPNGHLEEIEKDPYIQFDMSWSPRLKVRTIVSLLELAIERLSNGNELMEGEDPQED